MTIYHKAQKHLARRDDVLKALIKHVGACTLQHNPDGFAGAGPVDHLPADLNQGRPGHRRPLDKSGGPLRLEAACRP